jgi:2-amino-4-hydroxy-6-hydroxymethyldihydropteridine diphosphokinase
VKVLRCSHVYETPPWGILDQPVFLNCALEVQTRLKPHALLHWLKAIEQRLGRQPSVRFGARLIDLDILLYGQLIFHTPELVIPHPRMTERAFVLKPLADLAPDMIPPGMNQAVRDLLQITDTTGIQPYHDERW